MAVDNEVHCDPRGAVRFLLDFLPDGPWLLCAFDPERSAPPRFARFGPQNSQAAEKWIAEHVERWNLYFHVNPTRDDLHSKASATDVTHLAYLHVDVDPRAGEDLESEQARIASLEPEGVPAPTFTIFSGGGYQHFWRLRRPLALDGSQETADDVKRYNVALERAYGADNCHDICRVMRLPFTVNLPDDKKRARGRVATTTALVRRNDVDYELDVDFAKAEPVRGAPPGSPPPRAPTTGEAAKIDSVDELDEWKVPDRVKAIIVSGRDPDSPKDGDDSRSVWLFDAVCNMVRCGVPDETIFGVITDPGFAVSESVLEKKGRAARYAARQIEHAKELVTAEFNPVSKDGVPARSYRNARLAVVKLGVVTEFDEFRRKMLLGGHALSDTATPVTDRALSHLRQIVLDTFRFDAGKELLDDAVRQLCFENPFDPVLEYLDGLEWDGEPRLDTWLARYMGAPDEEYVRAVGRLLLVAAVRRARAPGCKFDTIVVLEGPQGTGKSSALLTLAGHPDLFSDQDILAVDAKQQAELMEGVWLYEIAELEGMSRAETAKVKAFASRQVDRARPAYGRHREDNPRRCVFVGTCNEAQYLKDRTGNRRFLPVETAEIDLETLARDRDQLWAEAAAAESRGESTTLPRTLWDAAAEIQEQRVELDPWQTRLHELTDAELPFEGLPRGVVAHGDELRVFTADVLRWLGVEADRQTVAHGKRLAPLMRKLGWEGPRVMRVGSVTDRGYRKKLEGCRSTEPPATPRDQTEIDL